MTLRENIIGKRIHAELKKQGKPQKWLAEQIGCTESSMTRYIDGTRIPKATTLGSIAKALHVDAGLLLGIEVKMTNADRIRSMTDEELGAFLKKTVADSADNLFLCDDFEEKGFCRQAETCQAETCVDCYIRWLKSEVKNDD